MTYLTARMRDKSHTTDVTYLILSVVKQTTFTGSNLVL
jgi:hypothetical protein